VRGKSGPRSPAPPDWGCSVNPTKREPGRAKYISWGAQSFGLHEYLSRRGKAESSCIVVIFAEQEKWLCEEKDEEVKKLYQDFRVGDTAKNVVNCLGGGKGIIAITNGQKGEMNGRGTIHVKKGSGRVLESATRERKSGLLRHKGPSQKIWNRHDVCVSMQGGGDYSSVRRPSSEWGPESCVVGLL